MATAAPAEVAAFWIDEVGPKGWYEVSDRLDAEIRERFLPTWEAALAGDLDGWAEDAATVLAFLVVTDQFPRNMFRGDGRSFATDPLARAAASYAIERRWDLTVREPGRQFFYLPLEHSEMLSDQDRCIRLITERMPETGAENLLHARAHRQIVARFGRFPFRNAALGRLTLPSEQVFLDQGGYGAVVRAMQEAEAM
ncbi:DUF924 family protein [Tropicimonas sp.]|uniref:DUF924 family protein n=1 Tax=Tropicimonas sp. TaxID=2067044 RepID=UPI003A876225